MSESMMCCPLDGKGDPAKVFVRNVVVARKQHCCSECGDAIKNGSKHEHVKGLWDGDWSTFRTCLSCMEIRDHFSCGNGFIYGEVWEQIQNNFFPDMKAGGQCLDGLSPAAKARMFELRLEWLLDDGDEIDGALPPGIAVEFDVPRGIGSVRRVLFVFRAGGES